MKLAFESRTTSRYSGQTTSMCFIDTAVQS